MIKRLIVILSVSCLLCSVSIITFFNISANQHETDVSTDSPDIVCGPRCIQFILNWYGRKADLIELVRETQWPDLEAGSSLDRLQRCMKERGLYTAAIRFSPGREVSWPYPVLLYELEKSSTLGHYIVQVPGESPRHENLIWAGLEGWRESSWNNVTRGSTGVALLTSPEPISDIQASLGPLTGLSLIQITGLALVGAIVVHLSLRLRTLLRRRSHDGANVSLR
jgi:ABC-type bacteriocin/lantibiotic exporter with double-glycine peptidase domain